MTLQFENEVEADFGFDAEALAVTVIEAVLDDLGCPYETEVSLLITGEEQIREINRDFRQIDRATDVLSFPMTDFPEEGDFRFLEDEEETYADVFHPETGELLLGDIVLNEQRIRSQAAEYGHSLRREFSFLIAHSMLHLCGFDHMQPDEAAHMERRQEEILAKIGITRDVE